VSVATSGDVCDRPKVADTASELLQEAFGKEKNPCPLVYGVASLPLGTQVCTRKKKSTSVISNGAR
jgi:hypothetical protein